MARRFLRSNGLNEFGFNNIGKLYIKQNRHQLHAVGHPRRLRLELLEQRRMLAITVDTVVDEIDGNILDGDISLRDAIATAAPGETIDFDASLDGGMILLDIANGDIDITDALTIDATSLAGGITIDAGNGADDTFGTGDGIRIFNIDDGNGGNEIVVTLRRLTLTGGDAGGVSGGTGSAEGGAIKSAENLTVADSRIEANFSGTGFLGPGFTGGGIYSTGTLTIENTVIEANATGVGPAGFAGSPGFPGGSSFGGGIFASGPLTISGGMILGNSTGDGGAGGQGQGPGAAGGTGGMSAGGGVYATGLTTILGSDFSGNATGDGGLGGFGGFLGSSGSRGSSQGGGLYATDTLAITNSNFDQNTTATGSASQGGGVYTTAATTVASSTISANQTDDAFSTYGGGIFASASLSIHGSTISNNQTGNANNGPSGNPLTGGPGGMGGSSLGGGVYAGNSLSVETSTIADNTSGNAGNGGTGFGAGNNGGVGGNSSGGGIYAAGFLTLTASTVSGNSTADGGAGGTGATSGADGHGNGGGIASLGGFLIDTSTISGNATGVNTLSDGGGIWAESLNVASRILHSTITENIANGNGGGVDFRSIAGNSLTVEHSIVAGNTNVVGIASDVEFFGNMFFSLPPDAAFAMFGTFISNLGLTNNGGNIFLGAGDPLLGALADNGGPTKTHALLPGSPAIDAGDPAINAFDPAFAGEPFAAFREGFDTTAADVTINVSALGDTNLTFVDYSNFTVGTTDFNIAEAPSRVAASAATRGLLLQANVVSGISSAINVLAGATPMAFSGDYRVTFDTYLNVAVPIPGSGTEQLLWGVNTNNDGELESSTSANNAMGNWGWLATENGYATDDATMYRDDVLAAARNGGGPSYDNAFTNEIGGTFTESAPAKQWVTVVVEVRNGVVTVSYDGNASSSPVIFFGASSVANSGFAMLGYEDPFSSISSSPDFQWGLFDNFRVQEIFARERTDQRGTTYLGVVDGDGDSTATIDIGAFELQPPSADFDVDGDVDGRDFLFWQRGFGTPAATKADGDADNDQDVDGDDLDIWEDQFGAPAPIVAEVSASVSEALAASDVVDLAIAMAFDQQAGGAFDAREVAGNSPRLGFVSKREPYALASGNAASQLEYEMPEASAYGSREDERGSAEGASRWEDALDEVFTSVFD